MESYANSTMRKDNEVESYQIAEKPVLSDRVKRLKDSFLKTEIRTSVERANFLLEAYRESGGDSIILTRARVLDKYLRGMTLYIDENPIVGSLTQYRRGVNPFPDYNLAATKSFSSFGDIHVRPEERKVLIQADEYFREKSHAARVNVLFRETV